MSQISNLGTKRNIITEPMYVKIIRGNYEKFYAKILRIRIEEKLFLAKYNSSKLLLLLLLLIIIIIGQ